jgi:hypothetical protein
MMDGHKGGKLVERRIMARNQIPSSTNDFDGRSGLCGDRYGIGRVAKFWPL